MNTPIRRPPSCRRARAVTAGPIQIVVTPESGNGNAMATALRLRDALAADGWPTRLAVFTDLDSLHRWAKGDRDPFSTLICVGGDATQSATARAAMRRSVPFVTVPSGFGNLFARAFNQPDTVEGVLDLLARGRVIGSDVGVCNGELFLCQQSYGLIADIQQAVEASSVPRVRWQRWLAYYRAALRHLDEKAPAVFRVVVDGRVVAADAAVVIVANVKTYGEWLPLTPDASPVDGLFDVFVMRGTSNREVFLELLGRHLGMPGLESTAVLHRGRRVRVSGHSTRDELDVLGHRLPVVVSPETAARLERGLGRRLSAAAPARGRAARGARQSGRVSAGSARPIAMARMAPMVQRRTSPRPTHTA
jgi:diacylglycerol kinase (ATP)